jgi:type IV pilus assembly protein PilW
MKQATFPQVRGHLQSMARTDQQGFSLIEVMVSLVIGLVAVGAVFANYINTSSGARQATALAQVTQDASLALGILRNHITMAGYSQPTAAGTTGLTPRLTGMAVFGCDEGLDDGTRTNTDVATVTCATASKDGDKPDALIVRYEADVDSTPTVDNTDSKGVVIGAVPSDCTGVGLAQTGGGFYVADSRFSIWPQTANDIPSLSCQGNGGTAAGAATLAGNRQRLVENITDMQIWYGMGKDDAAGKAGRTIVRYVHASDMPPPDPSAQTHLAAWNNVIAVRICLVARSATDVLDAPTPYRNCMGAPITPGAGDRHIYRAFTSTVVLNNRTSFK